MTTEKKKVSPKSLPEAQSKGAFKASKMIWSHNGQTKPLTIDDKGVVTVESTDGVDLIEVAPNGKLTIVLS